MSQQIPSIFSFGEASNDAMNLTNYVDQMFNEEPVDQIPISMSTVSSEDQKLDNKLNVNVDNMSTIGGENLRAYAYPGDDLQPIDLEEVYKAGNMYTATIAGWLVFSNKAPIAYDYIKLRNTYNGMVSFAQSNEDVTFVGSDAPEMVYDEDEQLDVPSTLQGIVDYAKSIGITSSGISDYLSIALPVSKYQVVEITYAGIDQVEEIDDDGNTLSITIPEKLECFFVPSGTQTNVGETISQTRDYRDMMAGIGFPDNSKEQDVVLPESGKSIFVDEDTYYSIAVDLEEGDYFSMYTKVMGTDLIYSEHHPKVRRTTLQVCGGSELTFDYKLTNLPVYFKSIAPKGRAL